MVPKDMLFQVHIWIHFNAMNTSTLLDVVIQEVKMSAFPMNFSLYKSLVMISNRSSS